MAARTASGAREDVCPDGHRSRRSVERGIGRCQSRPPVSRDTVQIRLAQPPLFLMGAVVIASLLPLFAGAASDSVERLRRFAFAGINLQQLEPQVPAVAFTPTEGEDRDEQQPETEAPRSLVEPEPVVHERRAKASRPRRNVPAAAKAAAACERKDKDAARAVYKTLERGDPQRKQIRKSCRKSGVWLF